MEMEMMTAGRELLATFFRKEYKRTWIRGIILYLRAHHFVIYLPVK